MSSWNTIESDPGVFTELVESFGVKGLEFAELYSLDDAEFERLSPVYGLIFLFKWSQEASGTQGAVLDEVPGLFFAKQIVSNACATQAILSILLNIENGTEIELGQTLDEFRAFSAELPSDMRGLAIENSETIRKAHNSFARPEPFVVTERRATGDDDVFHFVAFVPHQNHVYELDGLKHGPVDHGLIQDESWLSVAKTAIQERIEKYAASEIKFNLLAIVRDQRQVITEERAQLQATHPNDPHLSQLEASLANEVAKRQAWADENKRRRHNYIPFVVDLFKVLAEQSILPGLVDKANEAARNKQRSLPPFASK